MSRNVRIPIPKLIKTVKCPVCEENSLQIIKVDVEYYEDCFACGYMGVSDYNKSEIFIFR